MCTGRIAFESYSKIQVERRGILVCGYLLQHCESDFVRE